MATSVAKKPPRIAATRHLRVASHNERQHVIELKSSDFECLDEPSPESSIRPVTPPPLPRRRTTIPATQPTPRTNPESNSAIAAESGAPDVTVDVEKMPTGRVLRVPLSYQEPDAASTSTAPSGKKRRHALRVGHWFGFLVTLAVNSVMSFAITAITIKVMLPEHRIAAPSRASEPSRASLAAAPPEERTTPLAAGSETKPTPKPGNIYATAQHLPTSTKGKHATVNGANSLGLRATHSARSAR